MAWQDCIDEIKAAAGKTRLSDAEIERMLDAIVRRAKRASGVNSVDANGLLAAAKLIAEEQRTAAALERRNALINLRARIGRRQQ
jgi:hypothetical protein